MMGGGLGDGLGGGLGGGLGDGLGGGLRGGCKTGRDSCSLEKLLIRTQGGLISMHVTNDGG